MKTPGHSLVPVGGRSHGYLYGNTVMLEYIMLHFLDWVSLSERLDAEFSFSGPASEHKPLWLLKRKCRRLKINVKTEGKDGKRWKGVGRGWLVRKRQWVGETQTKRPRGWERCWICDGRDSESFFVSHVLPRRHLCCDWMIWDLEKIK